MVRHQRQRHVTPPSTSDEDESQVTQDSDDTSDTSSTASPDDSSNNTSDDSQDPDDYSSLDVSDIGGDSSDSDDGSSNGSSEGSSSSDDDSSDESGSSNESDDHDEDDSDAVSSEMDDEVCSSDEFDEGSSSSEEAGSEADSSSSEEEEEEEEEESDASENDEEDNSSIKSTDYLSENSEEKKSRRKHPLSREERIELIQFQRAVKSGRRQFFHMESKVDPDFFDYLKKMSKWHKINLVTQRKIIKEEKAKEIELSLYDPIDGVLNGMKSIWDAIQSEVDELPIARRLSSPLKFRKLVELFMEQEHTGRARRMIAMEKSILHTVLYILKNLNAKIQPKHLSFGLETPLRELLQETTDDENEDTIMEQLNESLAVASAPPSRRPRSRSRPNTIPEDDETELSEHKSSANDPKSEHHTWADALPLRTRSSLRRSSLKAARPTTFTNIPPKAGKKHHGSESAHTAASASKSKSKKDTHSNLVASSSNASTHSVTFRPSSAPPIDLVTPPATTTNTRKRRRAPNSNETASTTTTTTTKATQPLLRNSSSPALLPAAAMLPTRSSTMMSVVLPPPRTFHRHSSQPTSTTPARASPALSPTPLSTNIHQPWIAGLITHRDDLHLFLTSVLFMAFVHVTDSEKLAAFKRQSLTALLHHAGWGKQAIQKQMHRMLRVPTVATGTTSGATAFSQVSTPVSNAVSRMKAQKGVTHSLHPNANMIYQFDAICLDLIGKDLLPLLSEPVPGDQNQTDSMDVVDDTAANEYESKEGHEQDEDEPMTDVNEGDDGADSVSSSDESNGRRRLTAPPIKRPPKKRQSLATAPSDLFPGQRFRIGDMIFASYADGKVWLEARVMKVLKRGEVIYYYLHYPIFGDRFNDWRPYHKDTELMPQTEQSERTVGDKLKRLVSVPKPGPTTAAAAAASGKADGDLVTSRDDSVFIHRSVLPSYDQTKKHKGKGKGKGKGKSSTTTSAAIISPVTSTAGSKTRGGRNSSNSSKISPGTNNEKRSPQLPQLSSEPPSNAIMKPTSVRGRPAASKKVSPSTSTRSGTPTAVSSTKATSTRSGTPTAVSSTKATTTGRPKSKSRSPVVSRSASTSPASTTSTTAYSIKPATGSPPLTSTTRSSAAASAGPSSSPKRGFFDTVLQTFGFGRSTRNANQSRPKPMANGMYDEVKELVSVHDRIDEDEEREEPPAKKSKRSHATKPSSPATVAAAASSSSAEPPTRRVTRSRISSPSPSAEPPTTTSAESTASKSTRTIKRATTPVVVAAPTKRVTRNNQSKK